MLKKSRPEDFDRSESYARIGIIKLGSYVDANLKLDEGDQDLIFEDGAPDLHGALNMKSDDSFNVKMSSYEIESAYIKSKSAHSLAGSVASVEGSR